MSAATSLRCGSKRPAKNRPPRRCTATLYRDWDDFTTFYDFPASPLDNLLGPNVTTKPSNAPMNWRQTGERPTESGLNPSPLRSVR